MRPACAPPGRGPGQEAGSAASSRRFNTSNPAHRRARLRTNPCQRAGPTHLRPALLQGTCAARRRLCRRLWPPLLCKQLCRACEVRLDVFPLPELLGNLPCLLQRLGRVPAALLPLLPRGCTLVALLGRGQVASLLQESCGSGRACNGGGGGAATAAGRGALSFRDCHYRSDRLFQRSHLV